MSELQESFFGCAHVRPKYAKRTCVGLLGQSTTYIGSHQRFNRAGVLCLVFPVLLNWPFFISKPNLIHS